MTSAPFVQPSARLEIWDTTNRGHLESRRLQLIISIGNGGALFLSHELPRTDKKAVWLAARTALSLGIGTVRWSTGKYRHNSELRVEGVRILREVPAEWRKP